VQHTPPLNSCQPAGLSLSIRSRAPLAPHRGFTLDRIERLRRDPGKRSMGQSEDRTQRRWREILGYPSLFEDIQAKLESCKGYLGGEIEHLSSNADDFSAGLHQERSRVNLETSTRLLFEVQQLLTDPSLNFEDACEFASLKKALVHSCEENATLRTKIDQQSIEIKRLKDQTDDLRKRNEELIRANKNAEGRNDKLRREKRLAKRKKR